MTSPSSESAIAERHFSQGVGKKIIKHIMPNFAFKLGPGGPTDHGNHRVMVSFPVRLFLTWFNWRTGHKFHRFCVIYLARVQIYEL
jgi:hypothetical protein